MSDEKEPEMMHDHVLRNYFEKFLPVGVEVKSIPLKQISFKIVPVEPHPQPRASTPRAVAALAAAAASAKCRLEAGAVCPRKLDAPRCVIENGVSRDIVKCGLARVVSDEGKEAFKLTAAGVAAIRRQVAPAVMAQYGWR
jgi:hypothetical protein